MGKQTVQTCCEHNRRLPFAEKFPAEGVVRPWQLFQNHQVWEFVSSPDPGSSGYWNTLRIWGVGWNPSAILHPLCHCLKPLSRCNSWEESRGGQLLPRHHRDIHTEILSGNNSAVHSQIWLHWDEANTNLPYMVHDHSLYKTYDFEQLLLFLASLAFVLIGLSYDLKGHFSQMIEKAHCSECVGHSCCTTSGQHVSKWSLPNHLLCQHHHRRDAFIFIHLFFLEAHGEFDFSTTAARYLVDSLTAVDAAAPYIFIFM